MKHPNVAKANQYARDVVAGKIVACKWIVLACEQHLNNLRESKENDDYPYYFDSQKAERALKFKQLFPHTKGKWARSGEPLKLEPWQCFFSANVFGWMRKKDDCRRYRRAVLIVPRKNGKSAEAATTGLYMLAGDNEYGAEVYSGATTEKQSWEVFKPAKIMGSKTPDFLEYFGVSVNASNISIEETGAKFEPLIGNPGDGSSPHCAIVDEYHEHKDDVLFDTMETGMGAREQPLMLVITTAGDNLSGPCYSLQLECQKALEGVLDMPDTFALIYTIDQDDDWTDIKTLKKANPNFGVSVSEDFLQARLNEAMNNSRKQAVFKTKHLNVWVGARDAWFNVERWNQSKDESLKLSDMAGRPVYIGMDLASKVDIAAIRLVFPVGDNDFISFGKYYLPESAIENGVNDHYQSWMRDGYLTITDGEIIDFNVIKDDILEMCRVYDVQELCYDPFQATMLVTELMSEGIPVVEVTATVKNFSEPLKYMDGLIRSRQIRHNGDPVMTWMISNTVARVDAKDNVFPRKAGDRSENKIDGVVAELMALNRIMAQQVEKLDDALNDPLMMSW
jgi:phage terminase large subunit-like protein